MIQLDQNDYVGQRFLLTGLTYLTKTCLKVLRRLLALNHPNGAHRVG